MSTAYSGSCRLDPLKGSVAPSICGMFGSFEAPVVAAVGTGAASGMAVGGSAIEGELTSSAQEVPEAGWKEEAVAFIPVPGALVSGFVMRSAREPLAGVTGVAMADMQVAVGAEQLRRGRFEL